MTQEKTRCFVGKIVAIIGQDVVGGHGVARADSMQKVEKLFLCDGCGAQTTGREGEQ
jgi:hypothetical protein